eukprot:PhM_4_TR10772/c0_g1_i1/m.60393
MTVLSENLVLQKTKLDRLTEVKNLSLWGTDLTDVSLLRQMPIVEVLSLSVNRIAALSHFSACRQLKELYLRKNDVSDLAQISYLSQLPLRILWLCDNPCAQHPLYRLFTIRCCPHLVKLDNIDVAPQERSRADALSSKDIQDVLLSSADANVPPVTGVARPRHSAPAERPMPRQGGAPTPVPAASSAVPGGPAAFGASGTQRAMMTAILSLLGELTPENQELVYNDLAGRLGKSKQK